MFYFNQVRKRYGSLPIMTDEKPVSMQDLQSSKESPWSRWRTMGRVLPLLKSSREYSTAPWAMYLNLVKYRKRNKEVWRRIVLKIMENQGKQTWGESGWRICEHQKKPGWWRETQSRRRPERPPGAVPCCWCCSLRELKRWARGITNMTIQLSSQNLGNLLWPGIA